MRFTLTKNIDKNMRIILIALSTFILIYLVIDIFVKHNTFGIFVNSVKTSIFGDEEQYIDPLSQSTFLEFWHVEIFFIMMILLTLSAIFIRVAHKTKFAKSVLNLTTISALFLLISLPLSYYISGAFVYIYVMCFFIWHVGAIYMSLKAVLLLIKD